MLGGVVLAVLHRHALAPPSVAAWLAALGPLAPAAFVALYAVATILLAPGFPFTLLAGAVFGPVLGSVLALLGASLGAAGGFLAARGVAGDWARRRLGGRLDRMVAGVEAEGWRFVALVRLVPVFPFALSNYALGLTRIGFLPYAATTTLCIIPGVVAYALLGSAGGAAVGSHARVAARWGLLALGALALAGLLPSLARRILGTRPARQR